MEQVQCFVSPPSDFAGQKDYELRAFWAPDSSYVVLVYEWDSMTATYEVIPILSVCIAISCTVSL